MKRIALAFILSGLMTGIAGADVQMSADTQRATRPLQAVFVWALGTDRQNVNDVELDIQQALIKHGVAGERSTKLYPDGMKGPASDIIKHMRATGCDAVLVVHRTSTIHWQDEDKETSTLRSLIAHRNQILHPKDALQANAAAPIVVPNATGNAAWQIIQGEAVVFDMKTGKIIWRGNTSIKTAKDLPQGPYLQMVADKVARLLESAGLIPAAKS